MQLPVAEDEPGGQIGVEQHRHDRAVLAAQLLEERGRVLDGLRTVHPHGAGVRGIGVQESHRLLTCPWWG
ncbi:hypothetical protein [Nonomuraea harbinensis]|uniref:Uncharacterized protein n=1 Tax=Nonomuraea harbinensis TaxID=1286938 RepID=A0ABW1C319_9ACTN|nr:hypothetical protein [Nonomuraea harbinensis]